MPKRRCDFLLDARARGRGKLCDKVAILRKGRLIASGTMEDVKGNQSLEEVFLELEAES